MNKDELISKLEEKYTNLGENPETYLKGLLQAKPLNYWDYIEVDSLLSLQKPRTDYPDEEIFIMYHQITELVLKLMIHELKQLTGDNQPSEEIIIDVENGPVTASTNDETSEKQQVVLDKDQFKYIKLDTDLQPIASENFFKSKLFWSLLGGPLLLIPIFILAGRKRQQRLADVQGNRLRRANKLAKKYLSEAKKQMSNKAVFYESLERALHNYLRAKLNIETSEFSKERIATLLSERSVEPQTVTEFITLLKSCEFARYTPTSTVTIKEDYNKAVSVIANIDKQIQYPES